MFVSIFWRFVLVHYMLIGNAVLLLIFTINCTADKCQRMVYGKRFDEQAWFIWTAANDTVSGECEFCGVFMGPMKSLATSYPEKMFEVHASLLNIPTCCSITTSAGPYSTTTIWPSPTMSLGICKDDKCRQAQARNL